MKALIVLASIVSLGWISAPFDTAMNACLDKGHSFDTCHHTINP